MTSPPAAVRSLSPSFTGRGADAREVCVVRPVLPHPDCIRRGNPTSQRERSSSRPRIRLRSSSFGGQEGGEAHRARRTILIQTLMPSFSIADGLRACSFLRTAIIHGEARELKDAPARSRGAIARVVPVV